MAEGGLDSFREQFLTCSICLEEFTQPRQLPCLHVFCHGCLEEILSYRDQSGPGFFRNPGVASNQTVTCPLCKKQHDVPREGVTSFPHDFRTQSLLDLELTKSLSSPTSPSGPGSPLYPNLQQMPTAPPIDIINDTDEVTKTRLGKKIQDHKGQLARQRAKLQKMSAGLDVINLTYDVVLQCIDDREKKVFDQVKQAAEKLKGGVRQQLTSSKQHLQENIESLQNTVRKMEEEEAVARAVMDSNSESQMRQFVETSPLGSFEDGTPIGLDTWMAPNLLFKSNLVMDQEVGKYLSPVMGSLCTFEKDSLTAPQGAGSPVRLETHLTKPVFPFPCNRPRVVGIGHTAKWRYPISLSGIGLLGDNLLLCHYNDMSLSEVDKHTGQTLWKSRKDDSPGGFFKALTSLLSTSQPSSAVSVTVQGTEYVAVAYPHLYQIKLYKSEPGHWHRDVKEHAVAYKSPNAKPDQMCCSGEELIFLEYSGKKLYVLKTTTTRFQDVTCVDLKFSIDSFCVLPSPAFNRLIYCVANSSVYAIDAFGNVFWSVNDLKAKAICADARGYLYVSSGLERNPVLHVLWHDGTKLQSFTKTQLDLWTDQSSSMSSQTCLALFDHKRGHLILSDGHQRVTIAQIKYF